MKAVLCCACPAVLLHGTWTSAAAANGRDWGPWGMHMMWGSWGMEMILMMALVWAALVVAMVFCIRWLITAGARRHQAVAGHGNRFITVPPHHGPEVVYPDRLSLTAYYRLQVSIAGCGEQDED